MKLFCVMLLIQVIAAYNQYPEVFQYSQTCRTTRPSCVTCAKSVKISELIICDNSTDLCNFKTTTQHADYSCNLHNFIATIFTHVNNDSNCWYPAQRQIDFGDYEMSVRGSQYGRPVNVTIDVNVTDFNRKNCLIWINNQAVPEYCSNLHCHSCTVSRWELDRLCASNCARCTSSLSCFAQDRSCSTGKIRNPPYNPCYSCKFPRNSYCTNSVELVLSFRWKLYLTIYYPECIESSESDQYVYCFTNAGEELRKRVNATLVFKRKATFWPSKSNFNVYEIEMEQFMGQYRCRVFGTDDQVYRSNSVIAYKTYMNEFAVKISKAIFDMTVVKNVTSPSIVRLMKVDNYDVVVHVSMNNSQPLSKNYENLHRIFNENTNIEMEYIRSSEFCLKETYNNLTWPCAHRFQNVLPREICLLPNGRPISRFCQGEFIGGLEWRDINGVCSTNNLSDDTLLLQQFVTENITMNVMENVSQIVATSNLTLTDVYLVSQLLSMSVESDDSDIVNSTLKVVDGLLEVDSNLLMEAQDLLNTTDAFLRSVEAISVTSLTNINKRNLIFYSLNPIIESSSGFVLYNNLSIKNIPMSATFNDIDLNDVKLAMHLSSDDLNTITMSNLTNVSIVAVIYLNDYFFPSNYEADIVINLNIPNYKDYLQSPVYLLINALESTVNCAYWDYGDSTEPTKGFWSLSGSNHDGRYNDNLQMCSYSHLTHLALLVLNKQSVEVLNEVNDQILSLITGIGSLVSIIGIFGIFVTSCMFRSWRDKTGTQILVHLSMATLLEIVFMYMNGAKLFDCVIAGCILQYTIISKFAWMLIYAFCQYLRFVRVFGPVPTHLILKSIIFGWGLGVIPALLVVVLNPTTYYHESFCYPNGIYLYLGLYLPVALVVVINFSVFIKIMHEITKKGHSVQRHQRSNTNRQIKLAVLLFSVLGIPWIFGFISNVIPWNWLRVACIYCFTVTSVLQGLLMFLFYVIFNKETKESWLKVLFSERALMPKSHSVSSIS